MAPIPTPIYPTIHRERPDRRPPSTRRLSRAAGFTLAILLTMACGKLPTLPDLGENLLSTIPTLEPMPTLSFPEFDADVLPPVFSLPQIPDGTIQPLIGSPPDWWYLVPIHRSAYAGGSNGRDYHYLVALPTDEVTDFYEDVMAGSDWQTFLGTIPSGSASMMSFSRDDTTATIYISSHDGGSQVSILIE